MFSAALIALTAAGAQVDLPTRGMTDVQVISGPPPQVAPVVIRGRSGPTATFSVERISHASELLDFDDARVLTRGSPKRRIIITANRWPCPRPICPKLALIIVS